MLNSTITPTRRDLSVSMFEANLYALVATAPPVILTVIGYGLLWGFSELGRGTATLFNNFFVFIVVLILGVVCST